MILSLTAILVLVLANIWTVSRMLHLRRVVFSLIKFNAGLVENMKYDKESGAQFSGRSQEYALETVYSVWREFTQEPDSRLKQRN